MTIRTSVLGVSILGILLCEGTFGFVASLYDEVMNLTLDKCFLHAERRMAYEFSLKHKAIREFTT